MCDDQKKRAILFEEARLLFRSWAGYDTLADVMGSLPELDIYLAGGILRDIVLGREPSPTDFDLFLGGDDVDTALNHLKGRGELALGPFGSPRWHPNPADRSTPYCDVIPIARFFNGLWRCQDIVDVLNQFDFTGNAIAVDMRTGAFYNPQNGIRDLLQRTMRAVRLDYPDEPIMPGHTLTRMTVLWFRIFHFAARLGLSIEPVTMDWLKRNRQFAARAEEFESVFFALHPDALNDLRSSDGT